MRIADPVTVTLTFERPTTEVALMEGLASMVHAIPSRNGKRAMRIVLEGISDDLAARIETSFAIGKAQLSVREKRRGHKPR